MTITVEVTNKGPGHTIQVHKVHQNVDGIHVEDGIRLAPDESREFTIWGTVRLAIEEVPAEIVVRPHAETEGD